MTEITLLTETTHRIQYLTQRALYSLCTHAQLEGKSQIGNAISTLSPEKGMTDDRQQTQ